MSDAISLAIIFLGMSSLVTLPLAVLIGLPAGAWLGRAWLGIKERELELRRIEVAVKLRESAALPAWVDKEDPQSLLAWAKADRELARLSDNQT